MFNVSLIVKIFELRFLFVKCDVDVWFFIIFVK